MLTDLLKDNSEIWAHFTRSEEYSLTKLDKYERFEPPDYRSSRLLEPVVSKCLLDRGLVVEYPDNKSFAVCLSHDVDDIYPTSLHTVLSSVYCLKSCDFSGLKKHLLWKVNGKENSPFINFEEIMDLEERYGAKSSFYFMATEKDPDRFRYDIEDISNEVASINDRGWEVGLHTGYYSYNSLESIILEKKRLESALGSNIIGCRNHYLRFKVPDTWELLSKAGFLYDTTFGYANGIGFRNGMCHPFKPYDLNKDKEINILEIPLIIMDGALLLHFTKSFSEAWFFVKELIDKVEKCNGVITFLWHNNSLNWPYRSHWGKLYEKILDYCSSKNAWMTSSEEIYRWWINEY
ncbi:hypothetical protein DU40_17860 [Methanosarcina mazei]|uniref:NodB homology domain-containing protein n=1 Tax=Methanosarcina mazei TaxID=2209 RepID=A0A0F8DD04_METMZ|nr:polysaccharide deacetylase family protein [Methanosarcina mazei]KKG00528.1 hypothetical protein DU40_17860 [Methanosarcina mazei]